MRNLGIMARLGTCSSHITGGGGFVVDVHITLALLLHFMFIHPLVLIGDYLGGCWGLLREFSLYNDDKS